MGRDSSGKDDILLVSQFGGRHPGRVSGGRHLGRVLGGGDDARRWSLHARWSCPTAAVAVWSVMVLWMVTAGCARRRTGWKSLLDLSGVGTRRTRRQRAEMMQLVPNVTSRCGSRSERWTTTRTAAEAELSDG